MAMPALIFDLDGTLVDSVYQHVLAWHEALQEAGIELSVWRIHRRIGMSGGLFTRALLRETGRALDEALLSRLQEHHTAAYKRRIGEVRPLPGARRLLAHLTEVGCAWAIATSGRIESAGPALAMLGVPRGCRSSPAIWCRTPSPTPTCSWRRCASSGSTSRTPW